MPHEVSDPAAGADNGSTMASHPTREAQGGAVRCPQCAAANPSSNRFCAGCGYALGMSAQPAAAAAVAPAPAAAGLRLTALRADGSEVGSVSITEGQAIGRDTGSIFSEDNYLSPTHAVFTRQGTRVLVQDAGSLNGVYLRLRANTPWRLRWGDVFRVGQQILRLESLEGGDQYSDDVRHFGSPNPGYIARLSLVIGRDTTGNAFLIPKDGFHLGRERGNALFAEDGYVSGLHCQLTVDLESAIWLTDLGSSNGSFVRLKQQQPVAAGDILLMGQQLFRVDL
jgi:pSer/pThr/pTyr-binding forkhead associated (FHA) protein